MPKLILCQINQCKLIYILLQKFTTFIVNGNIKYVVDEKLKSFLELLGYFLSIS